MLKNIKLNMSRRIRRTPYTGMVEKHGVSDFTVVNHMLLPKGFKNSVETDYWHLSKEVQMWDVSCQRQVQISGPDASKLVQRLTPRSITKMETGKCFYIPILNENAGMINDPVLLKLDDDMFWISIADSDILLWAKAYALGLNLNVNIQEPDVYPLAIQGPKSESLMIKVFGEDIKKIKFFNFRVVDFLGTKQVVARSGYSKQDGFEIYLKGFGLGKKLWETIWEAGKEFNISPGCPNLIDRIEGGLLSYGNDMDMNDTPLECGLDAFVSFNPKIEYLGKSILEKQHAEGVNRSLVGLKLQMDKISITKFIPIFQGSKMIGELRSACFSPKFQCCLGIAMVDKSEQDTSKPLQISIEGNQINAEMTSIPFKK